LSRLSLPSIVAPHLERLVASVHESSSLSVLDGDDIVRARHAAPPDHPDRAHHRRAAHLPGEGAAEGYALVDQELQEGLRATAAPIHDRSGTVNVPAHAARVTADAMRRRFLPALLGTTAAHGVGGDASRTT